MVKAVGRGASLALLRQMLQSCLNVADEVLQRAVQRQRTTRSVQHDDEVYRKKALLAHIEEL